MLFKLVVLAVVLVCALVTVLKFWSILRELEKATRIAKGAGTYEDADVERSKSLFFALEITAAGARADLINALKWAFVTAIAAAILAYVLVYSNPPRVFYRRSVPTQSASLGLFC